MSKRTVAIILAVVLAVAGGLACDGAPKPQCQDGSVKVEVRHGKSRTYHCHNGEWIKE